MVSVQNVKFEFLEMSTTNIKFILHSNVSFANALRRILLGEMNCLAIDYVEIVENTSVFADECLAHRLGLIPLNDNVTLLDKKDCTCENYCEKCACIMILNKRNDSNQNITVYGRDIKVQGEKKDDVLNENVVICKLAPRQHVNLKCIARRDGNRNFDSRVSHIKHCPVTAVSFSYDEENNKKHTNLWRENEESARETWPTIDEDADIFDTNKVEKIIMNVEIVEGVGKPKEILLKALNVYKNKFEKILEQI